MSASETAGLHRQLVDLLSDRGLLSDARLEAAFRAVPRHLFLPGRDLAEVYADQAVLTHRTAEGLGTSSSSQPAIMALMLAQLDVRPEHRVLEIGAGTGYNAALLAQLVGPEGHVVSVDLDAEVAEEAREHLASAGVENVEVVAADGGLGYAPAAPYDRLIVTCGPSEIPPAWWTQLEPDGRLVVPLTLAPGVARSCAFEFEDGVLVARSLEPCGFMPLRGEYGTDAIGGVVLGEGVHLAVSPDLGTEPDVIRSWFARQPRVHRLPVTLEDRAFWESDVRLQLALDQPSAAVVHVVGPAAHDLRWPLVQRSGEGSGAWGTTFGFAAHDGLSLLGWTQKAPELLAAFGYGPDPEPQERLVRVVEKWVEAGRPVAGPLRLRAYAAGVEPAVGPGDRVVSRRTCTLVIGL